METYNDLIGEYLRGVMQQGEDVYLFLKDKAVVLTSDNQDYDWQSNWRISKVIKEKYWPSREEGYKAIGETITDVESDDYSLDINDIDADMDKWIQAVGKGSWNAKEGENYELFRIKTKTKVVSFGTVYWDCHYPSTIWDVIE